MRRNQRWKNRDNKIIQIFESAFSFSTNLLIRLTVSKFQDEQERKQNSLIALTAGAGKFVLFVLLTVNNQL